MVTKLIDKNDIKIFILYLLRHIEYPLNFETINEIVIQDGFVGYFDFAECFAELLDTENIKEISVQGNDLYIITDQGINVSDNLESKLLGLIKDQALKSALRLLSFKQKGAELKFDITPNSNGTYFLECSIIEKNDKILSVHLLVDTLSQVKKIENNFKNKPEVVYRGIMALLSGDLNYFM